MTRHVSGDIEVAMNAREMVERDVEVAVHPHVRRFQLMDIDVKDLQEHNCAQDGRNSTTTCGWVGGGKQVNSRRQPKRANGCPKMWPLGSANKRANRGGVTSTPKTNTVAPRIREQQDVRYALARLRVHACMYVCVARVCGMWRRYVEEVCG